MEGRSKRYTGERGEKSTCGYLYNRTGFIFADDIFLHLERLLTFDLYFHVFPFFWGRLAGLDKILGTEVSVDIDGIPAFKRRNKFEDYYFLEVPFANILK